MSGFDAHTTSFREFRGGTVRASAGLAVLLVVAAMAGCSAESNYAGSMMPAGQTCQSIRADLNKLDARGVPRYVEAVGAGRKVTPQQKADADLYNRLLSQYLGSKCHV